MNSEKSRSFLDALVHRSLHEGGRAAVLRVGGDCGAAVFRAPLAIVAWPQNGTSMAGAK